MGACVCRIFILPLRPTSVTLTSLPHLFRGALSRRARRVRDVSFSLSLCVCVCVDVCMHAVFVYISGCMCIYFCICVYVYGMYACIFKACCVCARGCSFVYTRVRTFVAVYVCVSRVCIYARACIVMLTVLMCAALLQARPVIYLWEVGWRRASMLPGPRHHSAPTRCTSQ